MNPDVVPWREALEPHLVGVSPWDKHWSPKTAQLPEQTVPLDELPTPSLVLDLAATAQNLGAMHSWCAEHGLELAPHGKTTMAPGLWNWQLASGCFGITVANSFQLRVARQFGVPNVVVANELISFDGLQWLAGELNRTAPQEFSVTCWADSVEAVEQMTEALTAAGLTRPLGVCVEVGSPAARTGNRRGVSAREIAQAVAEAPVLELCGVSGYEGSVGGETPEEVSAGVRTFLADMRRTFTELADLYETECPILTAGGSAWFDLVAEVFDGVASEVPGARIVLRSGAYIIHDHVKYAWATPSATRSGPVLKPAAALYAHVLSTPEAGRALLDAGKRDLPYDMGLPVPLQIRRRDGTTDTVPSGALAISRMDDQHAYLDGEVPAVQVGDVVKLGLSHPCTMFDKFRTVLLVEDSLVVGALPTYF